MNFFNPKLLYNGVIYTTRVAVLDDFFVLKFQFFMMTSFGSYLKVCIDLKNIFLYCKGE